MDKIEKREYIKGSGLIKTFGSSLSILLLVSPNPPLAALSTINVWSGNTDGQHAAQCYEAA